MKKEMIKNFQTRIVVLSGKKATYFDVYKNTIDWKIVRLIWIAYFKNDHDDGDKVNNNDKCYFYKLPKDVVNHLIQYLGNVVQHTSRPYIKL